VKYYLGYQIIETWGELATKENGVAQAMTSLFLKGIIRDDVLKKIESMKVPRAEMVSRAYSAMVMEKDFVDEIQKAYGLPPIRSGNRDGDPDLDPYFEVDP
jgi:hypothetical protein